MPKLADVAKNRKAYRINVRDCVVENNNRETRVNKGLLMRQILSYGSVHTAIKGFLNPDGKFVIVSGRGRFECVLELIGQDWDALSQYEITKEDFKNIDLEALGMLPAENFPAPQTDGDFANLLIQEISDNDAESFKPIEVAKIARKLISQYGWSQDWVAKQLGRSSAYIGQLLALLDTPIEIQELIVTGEVAAANVTRLYQSESIETATEVLMEARAAKVGETIKPKDIKAVQSRRAMVAATSPVATVVPVPPNVPVVPVPPAPEIVPVVPKAKTTATQLKSLIRDLLCDLKIGDRQDGYVLVHLDLETLQALADAVDWEL